MWILRFVIAGFEIKPICLQGNSLGNWVLKLARTFRAQRESITDSTIASNCILKFHGLAMLSSQILRPATNVSFAQQRATGPTERQCESQPGFKIRLPRRGHPGPWPRRTTLSPSGGAAGPVQNEKMGPLSKSASSPSPGFSETMGYPPPFTQNSAQRSPFQGGLPRPK